MNETARTGDHEDAAIDEIEQRMGRGEKVSLQDKLKVLRRREGRLSSEHRLATQNPRPKGIGRLFRRLESVRNQIVGITQEIQDSGDKGGGVMGQGSIDDTHNVPR